MDSNHEKCQNPHVGFTSNFQTSKSSTCSCNDLFRNSFSR